MAAPLLQIENVRRARAETFELMIEALTVGPKDSLAIVGESGCGKSTALDLLATALRPDRADRFDFTPGGDGAKVSIARLWESDDRAGLRAVRARHIGYILQTGGLVPFLSLAENAMLSRRLLGLDGPGPLAALLETLGIAHVAARKPRHVSIGQRQRGAIARALAHEPALVLADEPTASLDPETANEVVALLIESTRAAGSALIMVTHDRPLAERFGMIVAECAYDKGHHRSTLRHVGPTPAVTS